MYRPDPEVVGRRLDDRFVLVNLRTNRIYELNSTAAALWELLEGGADPSTLESELQERFQVDTDTLQREIDDVLKVMTDGGLVTAA